MTLGIVDLPPVVAFVGDDSRGPFPFTIGGVSVPYGAASHVFVQRISSVGVISDLTEGVHYDLVSVEQDTDTSLFTAEVLLRGSEDVLAAAVGSTPAERLVVWREAPIDQTWALEFNQRFPSAAFTRLQNKVALGLQDLRAQIARAPLAPVGDPVAELGDRLTRRGKVLAGNATTGLLEMTPIASVTDGEGSALVQEFSFTAEADQSEFTLSNVSVDVAAAVLVWVGGARQPSSSYGLALSGDDTLLSLGESLDEGVAVNVLVLGSLGTADVAVSADVAPALAGTIDEAAEILADGEFQTNGPVARSYRARFAETISVLEWNKEIGDTEYHPTTGAFVGGTDATEAIQAAFDWIKDNARQGRQKLYFPAMRAARTPGGLYLVTNTITIETGVDVYGDGGGHHHDITDVNVNIKDAASALCWSNASALPVIDLAPTGPGRALGGASFNGLAIYCNLQASHGIRAKSVRSMSGEIYVEHATDACVEFGVVANDGTVDEARDSQFSGWAASLLIRGKCTGASGGAIVALNGDSLANSSFNHLSVVGSYLDAVGHGAAIDLINCDNLSFEEVRLFRFPGGTARPLISRGSNTSYALTARANEFWHFSAGAYDGSDTEPLFEGAESGKAYGSIGNRMHLDSDNNTPEPIIETGAQCIYTTQHRALDSSVSDDGLDLVAEDVAGMRDFLGIEVDGTAASNSDARFLSTKALRTYVAAQIAAAVSTLLDGVSSAFDTLNELAAGLALKAPLASPTFTGTPAAPTAAVGTNTTQVATTEFVLAQKTAAFHARLAADQTGIAAATATKVTFDTEDFDVLAAFESNKWTPPAGMVQIGLRLAVSGLTVGGTCIAMIYKNGALRRANRIAADAGGTAWIEVTTLESANGTDYYEAFVFGASGGTVTVENDAHYTCFWGKAV